MIDHVKYLNGNQVLRKRKGHMTVELYYLDGNLVIYGNLGKIILIPKIIGYRYLEKFFKSRICI